MLSPTLNDIIQDVQTLTYEERHTFLEYLTKQVVSQKKQARPVIQLGGVLGSLTVSADDDPIADVLDELARERAISSASIVRETLTDFEHRCTSRTLTTNQEDYANL